jgi:hypothetical protein
VPEGVGVDPDEFDATNSICDGNPLYHFSPRGVAATMSDFRIPADSGVQGRGENSELEGGDYGLMFNRLINTN